MTSLCHIRRATPEDAETIIDGINTICREGGAFYVTQFVPTRQWQAVLFQPNTVPKHLLAVAELDGHFAGAGRLFAGEEHTLFRHVAELGMFVLQPHRRRGIGQSLLTWMLAWAKNAGAEKITLSVLAANQPAIRLYQKFGFTEEGRLKRQIKCEDQYLDLILMAYFIN